MDDAGVANPTLFANGIPLELEMLAFGPTGSLASVTFTAELKKKK